MLTLILMMTHNGSDFQLTSYDYHLPEEQIAKKPLSKRDESRLLVYDVNNDQITHSQFKNLADFLPADHLLVLNETKVFPCRLLGKKESGGHAEIFVLSLSQRSNKSYEVLINTTRKKKVGDKFLLSEGKLQAEIVGLTPNGHFELVFLCQSLLLQKILCRSL